MIFRFSDIIPKEHGAWAILLVPFFTGAFAKQNPGVPAFLLLICVISLYLLRGSIEFYFSHQNKQKEQQIDLHLFYLYTSFILALFFITTSVLLFYFKFWYLVQIGFLALCLFVLYYLFFQKKISRINQQLMALLGLTLTAPAAYYVTSGKWDSNVILLWVLNIIFFQLGLLYVHNKISLYKKRMEIIGIWGKLKFSKNLITGWCISLAVFYFLFLTGLIRPAIFITLFPITVHIITGIFLDKKDLHIKRMGYSQVGEDILFLIILVYLFRTS